MPSILGTPYEIADTQLSLVNELARDVCEMRKVGALTPEVLGRLRRYFRIKNIYHSNAIEGNLLNVGETQLVVEQGLTITGKPLKDQAEARNLSAALDFLEELARNTERPITEADVRQIHFLVLKGISDANAGVYRTVQVEITGSQFRPPPPESVSAQMREFGHWLQEASVARHEVAHVDPMLVAAAAHTWFVTIHPFVDGNGRVARLLMNLILMRYGYPIAIITKEDRLRYYDALESSQSSDLTPFVALTVDCVRESLEEYQAAAAEQREQMEWARSLAAKFDQPARVKASNQYEVWKNAMDLLKSLFKQTSDDLSANLQIGEVWFKDFGTLEFEKYLSLKTGGSAKKTWFFRVDFKRDGRTARYLFFFGYPSHALRKDADVTLHISREHPPGSFFYERLDSLTAPNVPTIVEVGYKAKDEAYLARTTDGQTRVEKVESLARRFVQQVVERHFDS